MVTDQVPTGQTQALKPQGLMRKGYANFPLPIIDDSQSPLLINKYRY